MQDAPELLLTHLRPYQLRAVAWAVDREAGVPRPDRGDEFGGHMSAAGDDDAEELPGRLVPDEKAHALCWRITGSRGCLYDDHWCVFYRTLPPRAVVRGGVLADEMGLGKTLCVLALMLARRMPSVEPRDDDDMGAAVLSAAAAVPEPVPAAEEAMEEARDGMSEEYDGFKMDSSLMCICGLPVEFGNARRTLNLITCSQCGRSQHELCAVVEGRREFVCLGCTSDALRRGALGLVESPATIVVVPSVILAQWSTEISAHVAPAAGLRVGTYPGVRAATSQLASAVRSWLAGRTDAAVHAASVAARWLVASTYRNMDVVLVSYEVFTAELHHALPGRERAAGALRRYPRVPCALVRVKWWRAVIDEAQVCGNAAAACSMLARELPAVHRWCVSGTPMTSSVTDLFGLWQFMAAHPFDVEPLWRAAVENGLRRDPETRARVLRSVFRPMMWRTNKVDVVDEVALPPLQIESCMLNFSGIEREYYTRELTKVEAELVRAALGWVADDQTCLSADDARNIMAKLLRVRQVCCHPQAPNERAALSSSGELMTLPELLERMRNETRLAAEAAARNMAVSLNGLGGIALCSGDKGAAASSYHRVLSLGSDFNVRVDSVLLVHAIAGLLAGMESGGTLADDATASCDAALSKEGGGAMGATMEALRLRRKAAEIVGKFLQQAASDVMNSVCACLAASYGIEAAAACRGGSGAKAATQFTESLPLADVEAMQERLTPLAAGALDAVREAVDRGTSAFSPLRACVFVAVKLHGEGRALTVMSDIAEMETLRREAWGLFRRLLSPASSDGGGAPQSRGCDVCRKVLSDTDVSDLGNSRGGGERQAGTASAAAVASSGGAASGGARCIVCAGNRAAAAFAACFSV